MMVVSYFLGQKYYPIPYNIKRIFTYFLLAGVLYLISLFTNNLESFVKYISHTFFVIVFIIAIIMLEKNELSGLFKINKKK
jgi:hypothetical protein